MGTVYNKATKTMGKNSAEKSYVQMTIYLPPLTHLQAAAIANKNGEPLASFIRRVLISGVQDECSASFKASNALKSACKSGELSPGMIEKIAAYYDELKEGEEDEEDEDTEQTPHP